MRRFSKLFIVAISLLTLTGIAIAGCQIRPTGQTTSTVRGQTTTAAPGLTTTTAPPTTGTTAKEIALILYFIQERDGVMFLVPERRSISGTEAVARAALQELIKGPEKQGLISVIPKDTEIRSIKISDGLATVDFSKEVLNANVGSEGEVLGIWQIVNTLTEFPSIRRVMFLVEGRDRGKINGREIQEWWGHVGLFDQPFTRNEALILGGRVRNEVIRVELPRTFVSIPRPLTVKGQARVFEATFNVRILDRNGIILADEHLMADDFDFGDFEEEISYRRPSEPGRGTVLFYFNSPKDGSEVVMASITVFLE